MSYQIILALIQSSSSYFCGQFDPLAANFEIAMLFFDFFLGSKSDIAGSFGTFLADIGGIFVNE